MSLFSIRVVYFMYFLISKWKSCPAYTTVRIGISTRGPSKKQESERLGGWMMREFSFLDGKSEFS